jgi:polar amino acid transport system permease protein
MPEILSGFMRNIRIFLIAEVFILIVALLVAVIRSSRSPVLTPLRLGATAYVDIVRGIPTIILLFLLGFGVPALRLQGVPNSQEFWAITTLVISYSAYVAEVYRAGIDSVHESQRAAARSLGLSSTQSMRWVVLPQAVRRVIPPLLNDFVALQKDSALLALLGVQEAFRKAQIYVAGTFNFTAYLAAALLFLLLTIPLARYTDYLVRKQRKKVGGSSL